MDKLREVLTLDSLHEQLVTLTTSGPSLSDGFPAFLFRGERQEYPNTLSIMDRHFHNLPLDSEAYEQLDNLTAWVMHQDVGSLGIPHLDAAAYAQHYGLPTQIFDFTASPNVAAYFAANRRIHETNAQVGYIAILDVQTALDSRRCKLLDLSKLEAALRARRQKAFGLNYSGFREDDFVDLKNPEIASEIGLTWKLFAHLPDDESFLHVIGADDDLLSTHGDSFASLAQNFVDEYVAIYGPLCSSAAKILANEVPPFQRTSEENQLLWSGHKAL